MQPGVGVAVLAIGIAAATSVIAATNTVNIEDFRKIQEQTNQEAIDRRDQSCSLFERQHLTEVNQLRDTYRYLESIPPENRSDPINKFIRSSLPEVERTAQVDRAPPYCDEPGVGLPEPDPVLPKRPKALEGAGRLP